MAMGKPGKSSSLECEDAVTAAGHKPMKSATAPIRKQPVDTVPIEGTWKQSAKTDPWDWSHQEKYFFPRLSRLAQGHPPNPRYPGLPEGFENHPKRAQEAQEASGSLRLPRIWGGVPGPAWEAWEKGTFPDFGM